MPECAQILKRDVRRRRVAQLGDDARGSRKILARRVGAGGDEARHASGDGGEQAVAAVLDDDALRRRDAETLRGEQVDVGRGFFCRHDVAREDAGELWRAARAEGDLDHARDRALVRRRAHGDPDAGGVGRVHEPRIAWSHLEAIGRGTPTPLALHGGTGLSDDVIQRCITLGCAKINISTNLKHVFIDSFIAAHQADPGYEPLGVLGAQATAMKALVEEKIRQFGGASKAPRVPTAT